MSVLVLAQHDNSTLHVATYHAVTAACQLNNQVSILVAGSECASVAAQARAIDGVNQVMLADQPCYADQGAENLALLLSELARDFTHIVAVANSFGRNILPRLGALLDVQPVTDIIDIMAPDIFVRPIYAGDLLARVRSDERVKVLTVRATAFAKATTTTTTTTTTNQLCSLEILDRACDLGLSSLLKREHSQRDFPSLDSANVVVAGGRALGSSDNFQLIYRLANKLQGAVGASRAAVDAGFVANELQIGQTGRVVAPNLYIAVGISGAAQHLAGMKDSKIVVAINKDPDAAIFNVADYGLVADLFEALPQLEAAL